MRHSYVLMIQCVNRDVYNSFQFKFGALMSHSFLIVLLSTEAGQKLSWESKGNNLQGLLGLFSVACGDDPFHDTCGDCIKAKFCQILVEMSNLHYQRVPKK